MVTAGGEGEGGAPGGEEVYQGQVPVARGCTHLVALVGPWKLPVMRLLAQVVEAAVGELRSFSGNLHAEARGDAVGALLVDQSESLEVPWREHRGDLQAQTRKGNYPTAPERSRGT